MATTGDASAALAAVDRIEKELRTLKGKLTSDTAKTAVANLEEEIDNFKREVQR